MKRTFVQIVRRKSPVDLDENFLRQVLRIVGGAGEAVTDVVDTAVELSDNLLPRRSVAGLAATDQRGYELRVVQKSPPRELQGGPLELRTHLPLASDTSEKGRRFPKIMKL